MGIRASLRQSARLKVSVLKEVTSSGFIFGPDIASPLMAWAAAVLEATLSTRSTIGQIHASIAVLSGLSLGLEDVRPEVGLAKTRVKNIDRELASLCSDAVNFQSSADKSAWGNEFEAPRRAGECTAC